MENHGQKLGIKEWANADKPREKLLAQGRRALSDAELIAILIASGSKTETAVDLSKRILAASDHDLSKIAKLTINELAKFKGIGQAKAITIIAALELGRRRKSKIDSQVTQILSSEDAYAIIKSDLVDLLHEEFWIILLNRANRLIDKQLVSRGGQAATVVDPKMIFKLALEKNASSLILAHNHPSGNLKASSADLTLTTKIVAGGKLLEIPVLDHLIVTDQGYLSMADHGLMA